MLKHCRPDILARGHLSLLHRHQAIKDHRSYGIPKKGNYWRALVVNCNSIQGKVAELQAVADYVDPDVIIGTESKLGNDVLDSSLEGIFHTEKTVNMGEAAYLWP